MGRPQRIEWRRVSSVDPSSSSAAAIHALIALPREYVEPLSRAPRKREGQNRPQSARF